MIDSERRLSSTWRIFAVGSRRRILRSDRPLARGLIRCSGGVSFDDELPGLRVASGRGDQDAAAVKVAMKQPWLRPALATSSQVPGTGMGIPDG